MPEIWIIRHGETEWSANGRHTGRTDIPLTPAGRRRAAKLPRLLGGREFAMVLTSPLRRAADTCRLAGYGDAAQTCDDLMEWDYGAYEGRTTMDIRREVPGWTVWSGPVPEGETLEGVRQRAQCVIDRALQAPGDVVLFAHGHILRVLAATWLDLSPEAGQQFLLGAGALGILGHEREVRAVRKWNVDTHEN